jgi:type I restriction enzyme, S subunit
VIRELKPYSEYRDSPLPWATSLPSHWRTERAKWLFKKMERSVRPNDEIVTCFRDGVVTLQKDNPLEAELATEA